MVYRWLVFFLLKYLLVLNVGNGWVAGGCWDDDITSDLVGSFQKGSLRSTSKYRFYFIIPCTRDIIVYYNPLYQKNQNYWTIITSDYGSYPARGYRLVQGGPGDVYWKGLSLAWWFRLFGVQTIWRCPKSWGYPKKIMVYFMENPTLKSLILGYPHDLGNLRWASQLPQKSKKKATFLWHKKPWWNRDMANQWLA